MWSLKVRFRLVGYDGFKVKDITSVHRPMMIKTIRNGRYNYMKKRIKTPLIVFGAIVVALVGLVGYKVYGTMQDKGVNLFTGELTEEAAAMVAANSQAPDLELDTEDMFSEKDLVQEVDMATAIDLNLENGKDLVIDQEGVYLLSGDYTDVMISVEAEDKEKVQLVLDGITIVNTDKPAIYVKSGDKVFVTTTDSYNRLSVTGPYMPDDQTNLDAVIFTRADLVLNGIGTLDVQSDNGNGISSKDDLKITGGIYNIVALGHGLDANDSVRIYDGVISITSSKDAIHSVNDDDDALGYVYIEGGAINMTAGDDAIRGNSAIVVNGGIITIDSCVEGLEASQIIINDGEISLYSTDDGLNATFKTSYRAMIEINGGLVNVTMANGDTDGIDSNGDFTMNGGAINVEGGMAAFDIDGNIVYNAGDVVVDGVVQTEIVVQEVGIGMMFNR